MVADMPAMLVAGLTVGPVVATLELSWKVLGTPLEVAIFRLVGSYLVAFLWIAFGSLQWWIVSLYVCRKCGMKT